MAKQVRIWHAKLELARGEEVRKFQGEVNADLLELGGAVEKVYVIGVGHDMVVTAVLDLQKKEDNNGTNDKSF